ncbi:hypothetical protein ACFPRL_09925 [Pseudoclavibacter helvolus]
MLVAHHVPPGGDYLRVDITRQPGSNCIQFCVRDCDLSVLIRGIRTSPNSPNLIEVPSVYKIG